MYGVSSNFLTALQSSNMRSAVQVTTSTGVELTVVSGSVSMDSTRDIGRTCSLEIAPTDTMSADAIYELVRQPGLQVTVKRGLIFSTPNYGTTVRTNLVTNTSFEIDTTGWQATGTGASITRTTSAYYVGTASLQITCTGAAASTGALLSNHPAVSANTTYTASVWVKATSGTSIRIELGEFDSGSVSVGARTMGSTTTATGSWQRLSVTRTMSATGVSADIVIRNINAVANTIQVDAVLFEQGSTLGDFFDGANGAVQGTTVAWTGTANASTSTATTVAPDGTYTDTYELVPLGVFSTDSAEQSKSKKATVKWEGSDRSKLVSRNRFIDPYQITAGTTLAAAGTALLQSRLPDIVCNFANVTDTIGADITFEAGANSDPWKAARGLFEDHGYDLRFDGLGVATAVLIPDPATQATDFDFGAAETSLVLDGTSKASLDGVYNGVVATGEGSNITTPVRAVVWDTDPTSPTYYLSGYGQRPYFFSSPLLITSDMALKAATTILARMKGRTQKLSWPAIVNPALEPLDIVTVTYWGTTTKCVIDALTIPLSPNESMTASARETSIA